MGGRVTGDLALEWKMAGDSWDRIGKMEATRTRGLSDSASNDSEIGELGALSCTQEISQNCLCLHCDSNAYVHHSPQLYLPKVVPPFLLNYITCCHL